MKALLSISFVFLTLTVFSQADSISKRLDITYLGEAPSNEILKYKGKPYTGTAFLLSERGKLKEEYQYVDGYRKGKSTFYHKNGKIYLQGNFERHELTGLWKAYYPDGKLMQLTPYVKGVRHGTVKSFIKASSLDYHVNYENGVMHGLFVILDSLGDTLSKGMYDRGYKSGQWLEYSVKKDTSYNKYYKTYEEKLEDMPELVGWKDLEEDKDRWFYENVPYTGRRVQRKDGMIGAPVVNEMILRDGWPVSYKTWYPDGDQLLMVATYKDGKAEGRWNYYRKTGELMRYDEFKNGMKHGESKVFHPDGRISAHYNYKNDMYHGTCISYRYNPKDAKDWERNYVRDTLHGISKEFHANGKLAVQNNYNMGIRDKMQYHYDESGKLIHKALYKDGRLIDKEAFYDNDQLKYKSGQENGELNGAYKEWYRSGEIKLEGNYEDHMKNGEWIHYFKGSDEVKLIETYRNDSLLNSELDLAGTELFTYDYPDDFQDCFQSLKDVVSKKKMSKLKDFLADSIYTKIPLHKEECDLISVEEFLENFKENTDVYWNALNEGLTTGIEPCRDTSGMRSIDLAVELLSNYHFTITGVENAFEKNELTIPKKEKFGVYAKPDAKSKIETYYTAYQGYISDRCTEDIGSSCWFKIIHNGKTHYVKENEVSTQFVKWTLLFGKVNGEWKILALFR